MTWTDEEREEAADACAMMASSDIRVGLSCAIDGYYSAEYELAMKAYLATTATAWSDTDDERRHRERWAEAEARLRCGWVP